MQKQNDLFSPENVAKTEAYARRTDPVTSLAAAQSIKTSDLEQKVFDVIADIGGATTHEIADRTGISLVSVSPRIRPLVRKNLIRDSGKKREGKSNRKSIVWEVIGGTYR